MAHRMVVSECGGPEVLTWTETEPHEPGPGEARVRHTAIGLNFIDVYFRTGAYPSGLPFTPGMEAAGVVEAVGPGVTEVSVGDRVAYAGAMGAYATERTLAASTLVKVPDAISDETAAAVMLKGMTAEYLLRRTYPIKAGQTIVFHAAAGGVGLIACQWARHLGAHVIGTVGSPEKAALARKNGCEFPVLYREARLSGVVRELTNGRGVPVVYDSVGQDTFLESLECLEPRGMLVLFGQSSGKVPPFDPALLAFRGSLFLTRPSLMHYTMERAELLESAGSLFDVITQGVVEITIGQRYPLVDAARAHADLQARRTVGSTLLIP